MSSLVERMRKKNAPKAWILEVEGLEREIEKREDIIEEYMHTIDNLARQVEAFELQLDREDEEFEEYERTVLGRQRGTD